MMSELLVCDLMSSRVVAVSPQDELATLHSLMQRHRIRHIPVVEDKDHLVGLVSQRDLLRHGAGQGALPGAAADPGLPPAGRAAEIMVSPVLTVSPDTDVRSAAEMMLEHKFGCLPVVVDERLVGILTEADFVRFLSRGE